MRTAVVLLLVGLVACEDAFSPPEGTERFDPPPVYRTLWAEVEDCSGLSGNFDRVRWYVVPDWYFVCPEQVSKEWRLCYGLWEAPHNIYLGWFAQRDSLNGYFTVRHEMLHDLQGRKGHPAVFADCGLLR